jgi:hypothetical protein
VVLFEVGCHQMGCRKADCSPTTQHTLPMQDTFDRSGLLHCLGLLYTPHTPPTHPPTHP